jgi:methionyl-tRNA formyltransferase
MDIKDLRIIFFGTPQFAVTCLDALYNAGCNIVAVVTTPDRTAGRGMQLTPCAVKQYALEKNLAVLTPEKLKNPEFIETLKSYKADVQVVVAFRMLPEIVWNMPPHGTFNVHASLLPKYRGAAPINWAIINGETKSGVTTFKLKHQIDTGNILLQAKADITPNMNVGELHDTLAIMGGNLMVETLKQLAEGKLQEQEQDLKVEMPHAPKLFTETSEIKWEKSCTQIHNLVRGLSPYPAAFTFLKNKKIKVFETATEPMDKMSAVIGTYETDEKTFLKFACANGFVHLLDVQLEGKKRMKIKDFLAGYKF